MAASAEEMLAWQGHDRLHNIVLFHLLVTNTATPKVLNTVEVTAQIFHEVLRPCFSALGRLVSFLHIVEIIVLVDVSKTALDLILIFVHLRKLNVDLSNRRFGGQSLLVKELCSIPLLICFLLNRFGLLLLSDDLVAFFAILLILYLDFFIELFNF